MVFLFSHREITVFNPDLVYCSLPILFPLQRNSFQFETFVLFKMHFVRTAPKINEHEHEW